MAFAAGSFAAGTGNQQVAVGNMSSPAGVVAYEADGINVTVGGRLLRTGVFPVANSQVCPVGVSFLQLNGAIAAMLAAFADVTNTPAGADSGGFTTGAAVADFYSLPANFGPGRGNWDLAAANRLEILITESIVTFAGVGAGGHMPAIYPRIINGGDVSFVIKNQSPTTLIQLGISLRYRHSIEM